MFDPQLNKILTFSVKDRYQLNYFICIKAFNAETITLKLNLFSFFICCCQHHERKRSAFIYFWYQTDSGQSCLYYVQIKTNHINVLLTVFFTPIDLWTTMAAVTWNFLYCQNQVPSFSCLDVWNAWQTTSGVYAITVTTSAYHSRRCSRL
jgi:hypothetical protein